jgi:putative flippase GtrA
MPNNENSGGFIAHARERAQSISLKEAYFIGSMGFVIALLSIPILTNLDIPALLAAHSISFVLVATIWVLLAPFLLVAAAYVLVMLPFHASSAAQLSRYAVIGCFNVALNASIFNLLMIVSGISTGFMVTVFSVITFVIVVTQSFFWSVYWTFKDTPAQGKRRQYINFFAVSGVVALINISVIYIMTSLIGAPAGISNALWANIALLGTIFIALIGNFLGYKYFVFGQK